MTDNFQRIARAIKFLQGEFPRQPSLAETAQHAGLSPYHFQRMFKDFAGISPKRFCQHLTSSAARQVLKESESLLDASYRLGLSSPSRLHDLLVNVDAITPGEYRGMGQNLTIRYGIHPTPFGPCLIAITPRGICRLEFLLGNRHTQLEAFRADWHQARLYADQTATGSAIERIFFGHQFSRPRPLPLLLKGTNFQLKVWQALLTIPEGHLTSYGDLAARIGTATAKRAVGHAVGKNPIAYLVPCHRVLRSDGSIGGYRWGEERKRMILGRELSHRTTHPELATKRPAGEKARASISIPHE